MKYLLVQMLQATYQEESFSQWSKWECFQKLGKVNFFFWLPWKFCLWRFSSTNRLLWGWNWPENGLFYPQESCGGTHQVFSTSAVLKKLFFIVIFCLAYNSLTNEYKCIYSIPFHYSLTSACYCWHYYASAILS